MKNKKELAIVFGITSDYDFALANVLIGIKKHFNYKNEYDIIVYHDGLNEEIKETLNKIMPCTFFKFKSRVNEKLLSEENLKLYSNMCLARFECFDLLKKYRKVIWHDVDILIQDDFSELLKLGEKSGLAMTYTDIDFLTEANFNEIIPNYNMFLPLLNSGIMVFGDKLSRYEEMTDWCYKKLSELNKKVRYLDQGILNLLVQEYNINVEPIDINKFCCHPARKNYKKASIIHAYGFDKFWNANYLYEKFPEWQSNLLEWAKLKKEYYFENRKDEKPLVSVIMSIFKRVSFLDEAIESILNQTFANFELLIVVEYSEEQENINNYIFKKFKDKRIRIINNKERLGFAESLNVGIKSAKGKYIARMDDDDISLPLRFEKQVNFLEKNKDIDILGTSVKVFMNENYEVYPQTDPEVIKAFSLINNQMYHPTIMMRKSTIEKNNLYYDSNYKTEDAELWSRAVKVAKLSNLKEILLKYRSSSENETVVAKKAVFDSDIKIIQKQLKQNLDIDIPLNEVIYLNGRINSYTYLYNKKEIMGHRKKIIKKVLKQNKKIKFYNQMHLCELFEIKSMNPIKRGAKKIIKPIYTRLMFRIEMLINDKLWNFKNENL